MSKGSGLMETADACASLAPVCLLMFNKCWHISLVALRCSRLMILLVSVEVLVWSPAWCNGLRIQGCCSCGLGHNCSLDLIHGWGAPYATGQTQWKQRQKYRKRERQGASCGPWVGLHFYLDTKGRIFLFFSWQIWGYINYIYLGTLKEVFLISDIPECF